MKHNLIFLALMLVAVTTTGVFGFRSGPEAPPSNYVVIGAFAIKDHAERHVEAARKLNFNAQFEINPKRNLFYVYVLKTDDQRAAFAEAGKIRTSTPFDDTWVFTGLLGATSAIGETGKDINPVTGRAVAKVEPKDAPVVEAPRPKDNPAIEPAKKKDTTVAIADPPAPVVVVPPDDGSKNFWFRIFSSEGDVAGDVDIIDVEKTRKVANYKGNQEVTIKPVNKSGNLALVCEVFGYRKLQKTLNFNQPQDAEGAVVENGTTKIPFELVRLQKGDFGVMYNVYFFKDAAIMRPESRYEVESLTAMMKGNLKYKIRIHGHTNGNSAGKVISMGESKNFFSLNNTKEGYGSAKKLSKERAEVIRDFLISQGIDGKRMEIKAWGGNQPLYDKMSPQAQANVRVEIEIVEDK